jgi:pimeloyl-ACP methyl ester carboxylesterase
MKKIIEKFLRYLLKIISFLLIAVVLVLGFFSWQSHKRESLNFKNAAPENGKFVQADDVEIFVQEAGPQDGAAILLIHGTGAWSAIWQQTIEPLAANGYHVIAIDLPPFGFSEKPQGAASYDRKKQARRIIGLLNSLNIKKVTLIGHSVGARPTVEATLIAQERVQNLVLVDPALGFSSSIPAKFEQNNPSFLSRAIFTLKPLRNAIFSAYFVNPIFTKNIFQTFVSNKESITDERVSAMQQPFKIEGLREAEADWLEFLAISQDDSLSSNFNNFKNIKVPTMILWGKSDNITPKWQGEELQKLIPNSQLKIISDAGHIPYIENTKNFNELLLEFLAEEKSKL